MPKHPSKHSEASCSIEQIIHVALSNQKREKQDVIFTAVTELELQDAFLRVRRRRSGLFFFYRTV
jgi:hypothetical protein